MLEKELLERDYSKLPEEYWKSQNLCWYLHDVILSIFKEVIDENLNTEELEFMDEEEAISFENCDDVYSWLKNNNRKDIFTLTLCKDLSMRLLGDFLNYIYEVLSNLERGKITIACDLLRKPFKDNLLYLEWILFDDVEISNLVYNGDIEKYALGKSGLSKEYIKEIVKNSISKNRFIRDFNSLEIEESIYDVRYNYDKSNSLELVWNRATHLVTTNRKIRSTDFNFIYNNEQDYYSYWEYLYGKIPLLLLYTIGVVENIFDKYFKKIKDTTKLYNYYLIIGKFLAKDKETKQSAEVLIHLIDNQLNLPCENCRKIVAIKKPESYVFYDYWNIICPICKEKINICRYFFLE